MIRSYKDNSIFMKSIVIGSGFGGIAAALRLRSKGHDVTLIEKHPDLGLNQAIRRPKIILKKVVLHLMRDLL